MRMKEEGRGIKGGERRKPRKEYGRFEREGG